MTAALPEPLPPNQHFIEVTVPAGVSYEVFSAAHHPGWEREDCVVARRFGHAWTHEKRSAILIVPSVVARMEDNLLINPGHAEFLRVKHGLHTPVWWDARLFAKP
jgi:RES domain-containing protein